MKLDILYPLRKIHGKIHEYRTRKSAFDELCKRFIVPNKDKLKRKNCVFLLLTPQHTNLGDHAIAQTEINMLKALNMEFIEITGSQLLWISDPSLLSFMNGYPILINGGGNLGTLWPEVENLQRNIVRYNPKSPIYILPNTIYYEDSEYGQEELRKSIEVYNAHPRLRFYAREEQSYQFMKMHYRDVRLVPDVVLSLEQEWAPSSRNGCLLLLRNDCEKTRNQEDERIILEQVQQLFGSNYRYTDMHADHNIMPDEREKALEEKFNEFRGAELIITDRLHAMIFAAITQTPCIVINSKSPKVKGCYEWIKHLGYICFVDDTKDILRKYASIQNSALEFDRGVFSEYFEILSLDLNNFFERESSHHG